MANGVVSLAHIFILSIYSYSVLYNFIYVPDTGESKYASKFKYLTFWNMILQTVYFGICVLNDIFGTNTKPTEDPSNRSSLEKFRDSVFVSLAFPVGSFVVVTFWGIYAVDRELVYPLALDKIIPSWLNHVMHSTVILFLLFDMFTSYHPYPKRINGFKITLIFAAIYQVWILWIAYYANYWVYTVLKVLSNAQRLAFFAVLWCFFGVLYLLGERLMAVFWKNAIKAKIEKESYIKAKIAKGTAEKKVD